MKDFTQLFLYVPGVIIFLLGSGMVRNWFSKRKGGSMIQATVVSCNHVIKNDRKGNEIYNYYTVIVEYLDPRSEKSVKKTVKSATEYLIGQPVTMLKPEGSDPVLVQNEEIPVFGPWSTMIGGALLILLALFQNQGRQVPAMICLAALLLGAGAVMTFSWWKENKRNLIKIDAKISDIYSRQISKETKILRGNKFTYYPVVSFEIDGVKFNRRLGENSERESSYKIGEIIPIYYDTEKKMIIETTAGKSRLIWGIALLIIGFLAAVSIIAGVSL